MSNRVPAPLTFRRFCAMVIHAILFGRVRPDRKNAAAYAGGMQGGLCRRRLVMTESRLQKCIVTVYCVLMMFVLGASDALRGVFLPVFRDSFSLSPSQSSAIIMCSYIGNLLFLCIGGRLVDRISRKKFLFGVMLLWMGALTAYLLTANYYALLVFMIFSLGASTMLSTTVNLITPMLYAAPAFFVNFFNFLQGAGISTAQNVGGRFASSLSAWKGANLILLLCGCVGLILLWFVKLPQPKPSAGSAGGYGAVIRNPACKYLFLLCGFYCITEHGLQNWLVTYGSDCLGYTVPQAARYLSFFFGGIMAGRLLFAPLVQKWGIMRSMRVFVTAAGVLYIAGMLLERRGMLLLCGSGLGFSILWPTIVLLIGRYYDPGLAGTATGFITGFATLFDVAFNACFGRLIDWLGFGTAIQILPVSMFLLCLSFFLLRVRVPRSREIL